MKERTELKLEYISYIIGTIFGIVIFSRLQLGGI